MKFATVLFPLLLTLPSAGVGFLAEEDLKNEDVVKMVKSGLGSQVIVTIISNSPARFATDVDSLLQLRDSGVPDEVIQAMLKKTFAVSTDQTGTVVLQANGDALPQDVGVYYRKSSGYDLIPLEPEIVTWKTGGFWKSVATAGLNKGHLNGVVSGARSRYSFKGDEELHIYCREGTSGTEYQLLRLWEKEDRREFRAITGGIVHSSGGADPNIVSFEPKRVSSRIYTFTLPGLSPGEYGLLAPGAANAASAASVGKIYAFSVGS